MIPNRNKLDFSSWLRAAFVQAGGAYTDGALLERFVRERDEAAFAVLVKRHGAMVLGVCRRVLGDATDAEDAFQATFLVLVKKARSLRGRPVIGDWLHGVARRTALKARAAAARRRTVEQRAALADKHIDESRNDWLPRLDEELSRLPEKYRLPIVLCDLENRTRKEAARQLGWPEGTVAGRIARGRELLAKRLLRGAQAISGIASAGLVGGTAHAAVPVRLVYSTIQAATAMAAGGGATTGLVSAATLSLTKGVVQAMFWSKVKTVGVVLVATAVMAGGAGTTYRIVAEGGGQEIRAGLPTVVEQTKKQDDRPNANKAHDEFYTQIRNWENGKVPVEKVLEAAGLWLKAERTLVRSDAEDMELQEAMRERMAMLLNQAELKSQKGLISPDQLNLVRAEFQMYAALVAQNRRGLQARKERHEELVKVAKDHWEARMKEFLAGKITDDFVLTASELLLKAELRLSTQKADAVLAHQGHLTRVAEAEKIAKAKFDAGTISVGQYRLATYYRIEAEIMVDAAGRVK